MEPEIDPTFEILLETDEFIAVNKSGNCPVHEGGLYKENCLVRILEKKFGHRYFPVYRLDRETSGIVVFAKKSEFVKKIFDSISEKEYVAVCRGNLSEKQTIDLPIGETKGEHIDWKKCISDDGKKSKTEIMPIQFSDGFSIVKAIPKTGRQHQIRVHLQAIGHPILNDKIYGESDLLFKEYLNGKKMDRQLLHLHSILIGSNQIDCQIPADIKKYFGINKKTDQ